MPLPVWFGRFGAPTREPIPLTTGARTLERPPRSGPRMEAALVDEARARRERWWNFILKVVLVSDG